MTPQRLTSPVACFGHNSQTSWLGPLRRTGRRLLDRLAAHCDRLVGGHCDDAFGVLTYHRIAPRIPGLAAPTGNVAPDRFRNQLAGLLQQGYEPWPLSRAVEYARQRRELPRRAFVVTFDDGYRNLHRYALPVLRELKVPATVFVATAFLDSESPFPFDDWREAGSYCVPPECWKPLTSRQCEHLLDSGLIELGAHSHSHHDFRQQPAQFADDVGLSVALLRERFGLRDVAFSFPFGFASGELVDRARQAGVYCALTSRRHPPDEADAFLWGRTPVQSADTPRTLAARLSGW